MGIRNELITKALDLLKENATKRARFYDDAVESAKQKEPLLVSVEQQLAAVGVQTVPAMMKGDTAVLERLCAESTRLCEVKEKLLKKAGVIKPAPLCAVCGDTGYKNGEVCRCVLAAAKQLQIAALNEKTPIENCTFDSFSLTFYPDDARKKMKSLYEFCLGFADGFNEKSGNLLFMGKSGLGKTHLSLAIADRVIGKGFDVLYAPAQNLFSAIEKEHFSYSGETVQIDHALCCDLLIIDDLGAEFSTAFTQSVLYNLVNSRILSGKSTIINTNLELEELESRYTARITSRLLGEYKARKFVGNDIRQIKALEMKKK